jgi:aldehyde:ferredoxin oxidoreductase
MIYGYAGTILRVDLSNKLVKKEPLPLEMVERFLGGRGFVAKILWDEVPKNADPLGEENIVVIATGPLTANFVPANGKTHFGTKSPASGGWADSNMGGHFGPQIKYAGYDVIVLTGKAKEPSYLFIEDEKVEIRSAAAYWGKGAIETETLMKKDLGDDFEICTIGPAGERKGRPAKQI